MKYKISNEASIDIENIWLYTFETWSAEQADKYYGLLMDRIDHIAQNPQLGKDYSHIRKGYLRAHVKHILSFTDSAQKKISLKLLEFYISKWILTKD